MIFSVSSSREIVAFLVWCVGEASFAVLFVAYFMSAVLNCCAPPVRFTTLHAVEEQYSASSSHGRQEATATRNCQRMFVWCTFLGQPESFSL